LVMVEFDLLRLVLFLLTSAKEFSTWLILDVRLLIHLVLLRLSVWVLLHLLLVHLLMLLLVRVRFTGRCGRLLLFLGLCFLANVVLLGGIVFLFAFSFVVKEIVRHVVIVCEFLFLI